MSVDSLILARGKTVTIQRKSVTLDNSRAILPGYATSSTATMFIQPRGGIESNKAGRTQTERLIVLYAKVGTDVTAADRLLYGSRYFGVESVLQPGEFAGPPGHLRVEATEILGEPS